MRRRTFLKQMAVLGTTSVVPGFSASRAADTPLPEPSPEKLPRWRGFNLLEKFNAGNARPFVESDFAEIAALGFNFVRLPMDYRCWTEAGDWRKLKESALKEIDRGLGFGESHHVHVQMNFHRAPGYTVASPPETKDLWADSEALDVCALHWGAFAKRYKGIPNTKLSFNLFNEPAKVKPEAHKRVVAHVAAAIRAEDPKRLIVCDGREWGTVAPAELLGLNVAAGTRGYAPFHLTHYKANWVNGSDRWPLPTYPLREDGKTWDKSTLETSQIRPWKALEAKGMGVMVGEFGCHNQTPHDAVIAWMGDCLSAWKAAGWGWALWNYRGNFGPLDSERKDVAYEDWHGHKLDREMLKVLQAG